MSNLNSQGHAISNIMTPPSGGLSSSQQDCDQVMPSATSMSDDRSAPYHNQPPGYIGSKNAAGAGVLKDSSAASTSNSSPVAVVNAQSRDGAHRRGVKVNNKRGPSKGGGKPGESGASTSAGTVTNKRRCVSNACIACRKRKSKCDGNTPSCAACSSVYGTECVYDPSSDHRRKGVYKKDIDNLKTRNDTLQTLIQAILDHPEEQVHELVQTMRSSDNLEDVAEAVVEGKFGFAIGSTGATAQVFSPASRGSSDDRTRSRSILSMTEGEDGSMGRGDHTKSSSDREPTFETELSQRMSQLRVDTESGQVRFIGGTSNLILLPSQSQNHDRSRQGSPNFGRELERSLSDPYLTDRERNPILSWTNVLGTSAQACEAIEHLLQMYFVWHYPYFTTLSRELFFRDFRSGYNSPMTALSPKDIPDSPSFRCYSPSPAPATQTQPMRYCTPLLFNAMLALGCHFTAHPLARKDKNVPDTAGDHFFNECKRLILENDEHVTPRLTTVQALALMSVREAGCAREERGWSYSGMSFRMGIEMGLHLDLEGGGNEGSHLDGTSGTLRQRGIGKSGMMKEEELDARRITFWGCFLFDKCWSNYMGRMPQLPSSMASAQKFIIIPSEDATVWSPYTDVGKSMISAQPARTRAVALQIIELCEISSDVLLQFYNPNPKKPVTNMSSGGRTTNTTGGRGMSGIRNLGVLWNRLEDWRKKLPRELEPQQGCLPPVLLMHMFHQLLYIHLFRPFLQSTSATLPALSLDPRRICVDAASKISKYLRFYKREYGLRQICNIAAYMIHSACTIHLLNLPEKSAKRDIVQGLRSLEDMAEGWLCARRALVIMRILAKRWKIRLPDEGDAILARAAKGRAEQFGLQEVPDDEYEFTYLDYRGSSASAVSPMSLASEPKHHSMPGIDANTPESGMQNQGTGSQFMTNNQASLSEFMKSVSSRNSPGLAPPSEPKQQQQIRQHQQFHQQDRSQAVPGLRLHTDESRASSPGTYGPPSSFPHQAQPAFTQSQGQRQYVATKRGSSLGVQGGPASTPPPQIYPPTSAATSHTTSRLSRAPSNNSQTQYSYFENQHPPSNIASPSAFYSDTGIPIGYEQIPDDIQGGGVEPNWCIRDHELVARGFLVQGWEGGGSGSRGSVSGLDRDGENEEAGGGGETPWDPFTVY
ncbi:fungal-specific transcription factor domain-containing protein [Tirmania nivea]|nr:fungal-specific transcription factor domain-containing protein [Tirmania nivea]